MTQPDEMFLKEDFYNINLNHNFNCTLFFFRNIRVQTQVSRIEKPNPLGAEPAHWKFMQNLLLSLILKAQKASHGETYSSLIPNFWIATNNYGLIEMIG